MIAHIDRPMKRLLPVLVVMLSLLSTSAVFAQGSIYGSVTNSDVTVPANGEISFFGYLDDTDEEIRIETSVGAGYDAGNWYDDFQNYLTEAPGNPYDYHFYNTANGEGYVLSSVIPSNSLQQEDIVLAPVAWPAAATGLAGRAISSAAVVVNWNGVPGLTYHVYRRLAASNGSFFRIDDPAGSLSNPGVSDSFFVDTGVDGVSDYQYMVVAEDGSGSLGQHSAIVTVSSGTVDAPVVAAITPSTGFTIGGTPVSITGTGFDMSGATATIGGAALTSVAVVSPFEITGVTPPGTAGAVDVVVTNTASGLASAPLVGGFIYTENNAPVVAGIPDQTIDEGATFTTINLDDYVTDADNTDAEMTWTATGQSDLTVTIDGSRVATITIPDENWNGAETITFRATDPGALFGEDAAIFTVNAVNDGPVVTDIPDETVSEGTAFATINLDDYVSDVDNTDAEMTWTYSGNVNLSVTIDGSHVATIAPIDGDWNGTEAITFRATDPGSLFAEDAASFTVTGVNDGPVVTDIPDETVAEGVAFATINLDDYVNDVDNTDAEMTWTYSGNVNLSVTIDGSRVATIAPIDGDWNGTEAITFRATDPGSLFAEDAATFTVTAVNDAPVVVDIPDQTIDEGAAFATINLDDYVSDVDNADAEMTWTYSGNVNLSVTIDGSRVATIAAIDPEWNGSEAITFRATDPEALFTEDAATFTVNAINDAPVVSDIPDQTIDEGAAFLTINLDDYVTDIDNTPDQMTWTATGQSALTVTIDGSRVATITVPDTDWNGAEAVTFRATDPGALFSEDAATFTVNGVNDAPVVADIPDQTIDEGSAFATINLDDYVSDVDNADAELAWTYSGNVNLSVTIGGSRVATIGVMDPDWNGSEAITFRATDPGTLFSEDAATFTVNAVNDAPVVAGIPDQGIAEGASFAVINLDDYVTDVDNTPDQMIWTYSGNVELTVSIDASRVATITTPDAQWNGSETITFRATDPGGLFGEDAAVFAIAPDNDPPVVTDIPGQSIAEGASFATINLDDYVTDVDNTPDQMVWTYSGNVNLTVTIDASRVATIGMVDPEWNGTETITFRATDPGLLFAEDAADFTVTAVNDAPVVADIPDQTVAEGGPFATINLDDYVTDADNAASEMVWTYSGNIDLAVAIDINRVATITAPGPFWNGSETVTFRATDPGALYGEDATVFTVSSVSDAPVLDPIGPLSVNENENINVLVTASDPDGTTPILSAEGLPLNATFADNLDGTGTFDFSPDFSQAGIFNVTFIASDGLLADTEVVAVTVTDVNQPPALDAVASQTVDEGSNLNLTITASDPDGTIPTLSSSTLPENATFTDNGDGSGTFDFNPDFTQQGIYPITFYATDGVDTDSAEITVTVNEVGNQAPVLDPIGAQLVYETVNLNLTITSSDPDGEVPSLSALGIPTGATFVDNLNGTGTFDFTPTYDQAGDYLITFKAFDGVLVDSEVVTLTVLNTNRPPVLAAIGAQVITEGANLNLIITATDADAEIPVLTTSTLPANATFVDNLNGTGTFDFTPDFVQAGSYDVTFYASDGSATDSELVVITVGDAGNQAPVLDSIGTRFVSEGAVMNFTVTASDPDGSTPTMTALNVPVNATFVDNLDGTGTFNFAPDFTQAGVYGVTFIASDGVLADSEMVLVTVQELGNQPPVFDPIPPQAVFENDTLILYLSATDPDGHSIVFSYTNTGQMTGLSLVDNHDGTAVLTYLPDYMSAGVDTLRIFATDNGTPPMSRARTVEITTYDVNQPPQFVDIGPFGTKVGRTLEFTVEAYDTTDQSNGSVYLTASGLPNNATFTDYGNGTGLFSFTPVMSQAGVLTVRFIAIDDGDPAMSSYMDVEITVLATNQPPVLAMIGPQSVLEGQTLVVTASATDADGTIPAMSVESLPDSASFVDNGDGTGTFTFTPTFIMSGLYGVVFRATDGVDVDKETVLIQVIEAGNQAPNLFFIGSPLQIVENNELVIDLGGDDPDGTLPTFMVDPIPNGAELINNNDGTGQFRWIPGYTQSGIYDVYFMAFDGELADSALITIEVVDAGNQDPVLDPIADGQVQELKTIKFDISASDPDSVIPILSTSPLPGAATFVDNLDYTGHFEWTTTQDDQGDYPITFYATDGTDPGIIDSITITITVLDVNRLPIIWASPPIQTKSVPEGDTLVFRVESFDDDGTIPVLSTNKTYTNFTFVDSLNGFGYLIITPSYTQAGIYSMTFIAHDGNTVDYPDDSSTTESFNFTVTDAPVAPVLEPIGPQTTTEGDTLQFPVDAYHPGGLNIDIFMENAPENCTLFGFGVPKLFTFNPGYLQAGVHTILFYVSDGLLADSEYVTITVLEAGNQPPYFDMSETDTLIVAIGDSAIHHIVAIDPEEDLASISMINPPPNSIFVDSGNGAASMIFKPDDTQLWTFVMFRYVATDTPGLADTLVRYIRVVGFLRGDTNGDNVVNVGDITYLIKYIFDQGPDPVVMEAADVNSDEIVNVSDAIYLVNYIFKYGPPPEN